MRINIKRRALSAQHPMNGTSPTLARSVERLSVFVGASNARDRDDMADLALRRLRPTQLSALEPGPLRELQPAQTSALPRGIHTAQAVCALRVAVASGTNGPHALSQRLPERPFPGALVPLTIAARIEHAHPPSLNTGLASMAVGGSGSGGNRGRDGHTTRLDAVALLVISWTPGSEQGLRQLLNATPAHGRASRPYLSVLRPRPRLTFENTATAAENMMASGSRIQDADLAWEIASNMASSRRQNARLQATAPTLTHAQQLPQRIVPILD